MCVRKLLAVLFVAVAAGALGSPLCVAADLTITAANVKLGGTAVQTTVETVTAGETLTAGQAVYLNATVEKYYKCDADAVDTAECAGIVLVGAAADGACQIATAGPIVIGATMTAAGNYTVSVNGGGVCPIADLGSGDYISSLGHSLTTTIFWINIKNYRAAKP